VQWSIISEGLSHAGHPKGEHSKGMLVWGKYSPDLTLSLHHNYFAHNVARNPVINAPYGARPLIDATNNVVYDWYGGCAMSGNDHTRINWKNNYAMRGINSNDQAHEVCHSADGFDPIPTVYVNGNLGTNRLTQKDPQWGVSIGWQYIDQDPAWRRLTPWEAPPVTDRVASKEMADCIVAAVGATAPVRDSVDKRVVNDFMQGTGTFIDNVSFPADFPTFVNVPPAADKDGDGMPDAWELAHNLNPDIDDSASDADHDGYTNIEEYLHYLSAKSYQYNTACMPVPAPIILNR